MKKSGVYDELKPFIKPYRGKVLLVIILKALTLSCMVSIPYFLGKVIESLEQGIATTSLLINYFILLAILYVVWDGMQVYLDVLFERVNKEIQNDIRSFCYINVVNSKMSVLQSKSDGEIITKIIRDTANIERAFSSLITFLDLMLHSIAIVTMMFVVNITLASVVLIFFLLIVIFQRITTKPLKKYYRKYKESEENLVAELKNLLSGFLTIKALSLEERSLQLLNEHNSVNLKNHMKIKTTSSIIKNVNFFMASILRVSSLIVGGFLYLANKAKIGNIFTMYTYSIQLTNRVRLLIEIDILLKDIETSFSRINEFITELKTPENSQGTEINGIESINFKNVSYNHFGKQLYKNLSFNAYKNDIIGIKGGNGTGKTTLTYLICGFYKNDNIYINDHRQSDLEESQVLKHISYALQNIYLFPSTVINNLTAFNDNKKAEAIEISNKLGLDSKLKKLADGYNTIVNEKNLNLSGGEKQLISLTQALVKDSDIIILDEINSALDMQTEQELFANIKQYFNNKIVFIISHKHSVYKFCNKIIDLDKQEIIEN